MSVKTVALPVFALLLTAAPLWAQDAAAPVTPENTGEAAPAADAPPADATVNTDDPNNPHSRIKKNADGTPAEQPAAGTEPAPAQTTPAPDAGTEPAPAQTTPAPAASEGGGGLIPKLDLSRLGIPALGPSPMTRAALPQRLLMDVVSGAAGAAVILLMGWALALPIALLPWVLPQSVSNAAVLGVPVSVIIAAAGVAVVMLSAVAASAALQRVVRPLLGPQPSTLGPILGALFFGGVGGLVGGVLSFLLVTTPPQQLVGTRDRVTGNISNAEGRALAIVAASVVAVAVPVAALASAVGGPISAEVEDGRAEEATASSAAGPVAGGPRQQN